MKKYMTQKNVLLILTLAINLSLSAQTPDWIWAKSAGGGSQDLSRDLCIDYEGNLLITGYFSSSATFNDTTISSSGSYDFYLAKYTKNGDLLWVRSAIGSSIEVGNAVAVDKENNVYVTGVYVNTMTIGTTTLDNYSTTYDIFFAKYDKNGNVIWAKKIGSTGAEDVYDIITDKFNNIVIAGSVQPTAYFDSISITNSDLGSHTMFIAKYNSDGKIMFVKNFGGHFNSAKCVAVDNNNNIIVGGNYDKSITVSGTTYTNSLNTYSPILIKLNGNGDVMWSVAQNCTSGTLNNSINGAAVDQNNNIYLTGSFESTINFGSTTKSSLGKLDGFICKYDSSGNFKWVQTFGGTDNDQGYGIDCYGDQIAVSGYQKIITGKDLDVFMGKYSLDGNMKESVIFGGTGEDVGRALCYDIYGNLFLTGYFNNSITIGSSSLTGTYSEAFLAKYGLSKPPSIVILSHPTNSEKCLGESITINVHAEGKYLKYQWIHNGTDITGATDTFLTINDLKMSDAGQYCCMISDSSSFLISNEGQLTVGTGVLISAQPKNKTIEKGKSVKFEITATGLHLQYQWQKNGVNIFNAKEPFLNIASTQYSDSGYYRCIVSDICGVDTTENAKLTVIHNAGIADSDINGISIFPNPARDYVNIHIKSNMPETINIKLFRTDGKLLKEECVINPANPDVQFLLDGYKSGIYILHVSSVTKNFVKNLIIL